MKNSYGFDFKTQPALSDDSIEFGIISQQENIPRRELARFDGISFRKCDCLEYRPMEKTLFIRGGDYWKNDMMIEIRNSEMDKLRRACWKFQKFAEKEYSRRSR